MEAQGVTVGYYTPERRESLLALADVSLMVQEGEFVSIVGPSGCGKTTFLKVVQGLVQPTGGTLRSYLSDGGSLHITTVFQDPCLLPWRRVLPNVTYGLELARVPEETRVTLASEYIRLVGLAGFEHRFPQELSGGMKQRVNLARALCYDPDLLLMDEPFSTLDAQTRELMQQELMAIVARSRKTVIFVTHSIEEAVFLSHRVIVFSSRPSRVLETVSVPIDWPRSLDVKRGQQFLALTDQIWKLIEGHANPEVVKASHKIPEVAAEEVAAARALAKDALAGRQARPITVVHGELTTSTSSWQLWSERSLGPLGVFLLLLAWEMVSYSGVVQPLFISSPSQVLKSAIELAHRGTLSRDMWATATVLGTAFTMAVALGIGLGTLIGWYRPLGRILDPLITALNATPRIALMPLFVLWFGIGYWSKVAVTFLTAVFPILINMEAAVRTQDDTLLQMSLSYGAAPWQVFETVALPSAVPYLISGIRLALAHALVGVAVVEMYISSSGIGHLIREAGDTFRTDRMFVGVAVLLLAGAPVNALLRAWERRFNSWRPRGSSQ